MISSVQGRLFLSVPRVLWPPGIKTHHHILIYILKSALDEYKDYSVQEIAEKFIEGVPQIRKIAIHQDHPDNQAPVIEDVMDAADATEMMSGNDARFHSSIVYSD